MYGGEGGGVKNCTVLNCNIDVSSVSPLGFELYTGFTISYFLIVQEQIKEI